MCIIDKFDYLCSLKGVTVPEAYTAMGINKSTISLWRKAKREGEEVTPSSENAVRMSAYFGYPTDFFLHGNDFTIEPDEKAFLEKEKPTGNADGRRIQDVVQEALKELSTKDLAGLIAMCSEEMGRRQ